MTADDKPPHFDTDVDDEEKQESARRKFLKRAGQVAVTTPAVTLLLAAHGKPASAGRTMSPDGTDDTAEFDTANDGPDKPGDDGQGDPDPIPDSA